MRTIGNWFGVLAGFCALLPGVVAFASAEPDPHCHCVRKGDSVRLVAPAFVFELNCADGLRGQSWENRLSGSTIALGSGLEFECDLDAAQRRISITGWKTATGQPGHVQPDEEGGYRQGCAAEDFDDSSWPGRAVPPSYGIGESPLYCDYHWARTRVSLPVEAESQELSLVLGGFGLFEFRYLRVFVNGHEAGTRIVEKRWAEPGVFNLGPDSAVHQYLHFGDQANVIAVQVCGYRCRTPQLDAVDPHHHRSLPARYYWPGQFEQYLVVGRPLATPKLRVTDVKIDEQPGQCQARFELASDTPKLAATVTYRWEATQPVLHKFAVIRNQEPEAVRLMNVRLGTYATGAPVSDGEQGFPVYIDGRFFASLAHPAGWAIGQEGQVCLRQYPGKKLAPGETLACMETVLGVARPGAARAEFVAHLGGRIRRVRRCHDKAYSIFDSFGAWPSGDWWGETEAIALDQLRNVVAPEIQQSGCAYDFYIPELWRDIKGDLETPDPARFPHGFDPIVAELRRQEVGFGLWSTTTLASWTIGENPAVRPTITHDPAYGCDGGLTWLCLDAEPLKTMLSEAYRDLIRRYGLGLVKFDGTSCICYNVHHEHLPGVYSTEAIDNAFIQILNELDRASPELFIMLYWGPRSPWWLLHADTLFEPGLAIEAAHPSAAPTPYVRDSVTVGLDQGQRFCGDVPPLGKDSLGIWLSNWGWNSGIGKERWQEGFVMDMCRGSLLAQPWSDNGSLTGDERSQLADFIQLLKQRADCFRNSRPILGDPWKNEPYGYCCSNGQRAFVALNNCTWSDQMIRLQLGADWGLRDGRGWDIYRWYPRPVRLKPEGTWFEKTATVSLRPFDVQLLEIVSAGEKPSLNRSFDDAPALAAFAEPGREIDLGVTAGATSEALPVPREEGVPPEHRAGLPPKRVFHLHCEMPPTKTGGMLVITARMRRGKLDAPQAGNGSFFAASVDVGGAAVRCEAIVPRASFDAPWQGWRVPVDPAGGARQVRARITAMIPADVTLTFRGHFLPQ